MDTSKLIKLEKAVTILILVDGFLQYGDKELEIVKNLSQSLF